MILVTEHYAEKMSILRLENMWLGGRGGLWYVIRNDVMKYKSSWCEAVLRWFKVIFLRCYLSEVFDALLLFQRHGERQSTKCNIGRVGCCRWRSHGICGVQMLAREEVQGARISNAVCESEV